MPSAQTVFYPVVCRLSKAWKYGFVFLLLLSSSIYSQTIAEKKAGIIPKPNDYNAATETKLEETNVQLYEIRQALKALYQQAQEEFALGVSDERKVQLLDEIHKLRQEKAELEVFWQSTIRNSQKKESYAMWYQPESTLQQLIMDYGDTEFLYIMTEEIANLPISLHSNLSIPRSSWRELIDWILVQNRVGVKEVSPFTRELFWAQDRPATITHITSQEEELFLIPAANRVCFLFDPPTNERATTVQLLNKFADTSTTSIKHIGSLIFMIAPAETVREILKIYRFVHGNQLEVEHRLIPLTLLSSQDAQHVLNLVLKGPEPFAIGASHEEMGPHLLVLKTLSNAIFISGSREQIKHAEKLLQELELQAGGVNERTVFWYTCKHTEAEEMAEVLEQVYQLLLEAPTEDGNLPEVDLQKLQKIAPPSDPDATVVVQPSKVDPSSKKEKKKGKKRKNFIVDPKTGSLILVVEKHVLPRLKSLIRKLDVPKKMVQVDVILFEKKTTDQNRFGMNLLKMGNAAADLANTEGLLFRDTGASKPSGLLEFVVSRKKRAGFPAFDIAYNFLMAQDNVRITSNPSVLTVNQTPATISIMDEISLSTGSREVDVGSKTEFKESFTRSQFGTTIKITPTVHSGDSFEDEDTDYVTLETQVNFDTQSTTSTSSSTRPPFVRREVKNQVRIADGQTVILGGLRSTNNSENRERVPFLGEIPGMGKLFSFTQHNEITTEMFIFITPKIIHDPKEEMAALKQQEAQKRPGDTPEFIRTLYKAKEKHKRHLFSRSLHLLFGDLSDAG